MALRNAKAGRTWLAVGICFFMVFICDGFSAGYRGLYLAAVTEGLGIPRSLFSISESCRFAAGAAVSLFFGKITNRYGIKKPMIFGFATSVAALMIYANAESVFMFYIAGALFGTGASFISTAMASTVIRRCCGKNVGTITGFVLAASGLGSAVGSQVISPVLYNSGNPLGFRDAYSLTAIVLAVSGALILLLLREKSLPDATSAVSGKTAPRGARTEKTAEEKLILLIAALCTFVSAASLMGVNSIYAAHMKDVGVFPTHIASAAGVLSLAMIASKLSVGAFFDKFGLRGVLLLCQTATVAAFIILAFLNEASSAGIMFFAVIFAFALPLETIVLPLIASGLFGKESYTKALGILVAASNFGFALSPPAVNRFYDVTGTYVPVMWLCTGVIILTSVVFQILITVAQKKKLQTDE